MKGLIIKQPWLNLILSGKKTLEMRSRPTKIRGEIALIQAGSGLVMGKCEICNCIGPLPIEALKHIRFLSAINYEFYPMLLKYNFAWGLRNIQRFENPIPYTHPRGAVIWVNLGVKT